nr:hypothetical protein [Bartonella washoeensis]
MFDYSELSALNALGRTIYRLEKHQIEQLRHVIFVYALLKICGFFYLQ